MGEHDPGESEGPQPVLAFLGVAYHCHGSFQKGLPHPGHQSEGGISSQQGSAMATALRPLPPALLNFSLGSQRGTRTRG